MVPMVDSFHKFPVLIVSGLAKEIMVLENRKSDLMGFQY
jgi:hypothetical protein